jgi:hypothetical protein
VAAAGGSQASCGVVDGVRGQLQALVGAGEGQLQAQGRSMAQLQVQA